MDNEIPVGDEQGYDYDAEIATIERTIIALGRVLDEHPDSGPSDEDAIAQAIHLLNTYADELTNQREGNA